MYLNKSSDAVHMDKINLDVALARKTQTYQQKQWHKQNANKNPRNYLFAVS